MRDRHDHCWTWTTTYLDARASERRTQVKRAADPSRERVSSRLPLVRVRRRSGLLGLGRVASPSRSVRFGPVRGRMRPTTNRGEMMCSRRESPESVQRVRGNWSWSLLVFRRVLQLVTILCNTCTRTHFRNFQQAHVCLYKVLKKKEKSSNIPESKSWYFEIMNNSLIRKITIYIFSQRKNFKNFIEKLL